MNISQARKEQLAKILKGTLIAALGAGLVSLAQALTQQDFGTWTPWLQALASVLLNAAKVLSKV